MNKINNKEFDKKINREKESKLENKYKNNINKKLNIENILCFSIILCPIFDLINLILRGFLNYDFSISTILRPIIPIIIFLYIFFKNKYKIPMIITSIAYLVYAICHIYIFNLLKRNSSSGIFLDEFQYLINYSFMIMNLFIFSFTFILRNRENEVKDEDKGKAVNKLKLFVLISNIVYCIFAYVTFFIKNTIKVDIIGNKYVFNEFVRNFSLTMLFSLFILLPLTQRDNKNNINKNMKITSLIIIILEAIYFLLLHKTKVEIIGFTLIIISYFSIKLVFKIISFVKNNKNKDKNNINKNELINNIVSIVIIVIGISIIIFEFVKIINENKKLDNNLLYEKESNLVNLVNDIKENKVTEEYMKNNVQKSIVEMYDISKIRNAKDIKELQAIYHARLIKNQNNIPISLFGNGYNTHIPSLKLDMEIPSYIYNFGVIGFLLYYMPYFIVAVYLLYFMYLKYKKIDSEIIFVSFSLWFVITLATISGNIFFNPSINMIITILTILAVNKLRDIEDDEVKIYNGEDNI